MLGLLHRINRRWAPKVFDEFVQPANSGGFPRALRDPSRRHNRQLKDLSDGSASRQYCRSIFRLIYAYNLLPQKVVDSPMNLLKTYLHYRANNVPYEHKSRSARGLGTLCIHIKLDGCTIINAGTHTHVHNLAPTILSMHVSLLLKTLHARWKKLNIKYTMEELNNNAIYKRIINMDHSATHFIHSLHLLIYAFHRPQKEVCPHLQGRFVVTIPYRRRKVGTYFCEEQRGAKSTMECINE